MIETREVEWRDYTTWIKAMQNIYNDFPFPKNLFTRRPVLKLSMPLTEQRSNSSISHCTSELPPCRWRATRWDRYRAVRGVRRSCVSHGNRCRGHALRSARWRAVAHLASRALTLYAAMWWAPPRPQRLAGSRSAARQGARAPPCRRRANALTGTPRARTPPGVHIPAPTARRPWPSPAVRLPCFA